MGFTFTATGFTALGVSAFATVGAGTFDAAGVDAEAICSTGVADADEASLYSHAAPIAGASPNRASAIAVNTVFMNLSS